MAINWWPVLMKAICIRSVVVVTKLPQCQLFGDFVFTRKCTVAIAESESHVLSHLIRSIHPPKHLSLVFLMILLYGQGRRYQLIIIHTKYIKDRVNIRGTIGNN